jgi:hypothetical protein
MRRNHNPPEESATHYNEERGYHEKGKGVTTDYDSYAQSRWDALFGSDWSIDVPKYREETLNLWSCDPDTRRNIAPLGWVGDVKHMSTISGLAVLRDSTKMGMLYALKFDFINGLTVADFEATPNESRSKDNKPCDSFNSGMATTLRRIEKIMMATMHGGYGDVVKEITEFITQSEDIYTMSGAQVSYNMNHAIQRVAGPIQRGVVVTIGPKDYQLDGAADVSVALRASFALQISTMSDKAEMLDQREKFGRKVEIMQRRVEVVSEVGPTKSVGKKVQPVIIKQEAVKKAVREVKNTKSKVVKKPVVMPTKNNKGTKAKKPNDCIRFLGGSLNACDADGEIIQCERGDCYYDHRDAHEMTAIEAERTLLLAHDSFDKCAIQEAVDSCEVFRS